MVQAAWHGEREEDEDENRISEETSEFSKWKVSFILLLGFAVSIIMCFMFEFAGWNSFGSIAFLYFPSVRLIVPLFMKFIRFISKSDLISAPVAVSLHIAVFVQLFGASFFCLSFFRV